jgi:hypothetical protein
LPAGAECVEVPESNTLFLMPRSSLMAAVRDRINGANGLIPSNGFPLGQQLETVKAERLPPQLTRRGIDQKICKQLLYLRRTRHRAAQASSTQRLRGAMPGSWRYRRLRAHFRLLTQMPIAAPVNFSGGQVSRNNTNSEIGRTDGLLTLLRHTACKVRWNVAFSYTKGTVRHCLLGNITENEPQEVKGPRRRLGMACLSSVMGHPQKNNQKKTTNPDVNRFTRRAACPETELAAGVGGCGLEAPVSSAYRFARERIVVPLGSSEWHESEPGANGRGHLCVTGLVNAEIRRAGRYGFVAPVSSAYRFATESPGSALFRLAHLSGTNLNRQQTDVGTSACLESLGGLKTPKMVMKDDADKRVACRRRHRTGRGHHHCALISCFLRRT